MPILFSYGTLQQDAVQIATFGRRLQGTPDALVGFERSVVAAAPGESGGPTEHANALFNGRNDAQLTGMAFDVSDHELAAADQYEMVAAYIRVMTRLASGRQAWVYVHAASARLD